MRTLVADDEATTRRMLEHMLGTWGYDVVVVEDGEQAWDVLSSADPPPLAVLDWMMPGLSGVEVCRRMRAAGEQRPAYTVLITRRSGDDDLSFALDNGADDFVKKPLNPAELKSRLAVGQRVVTYGQELRRYAREMETLAESRAKQLVHADRMATLGLLSAGVAHEVNNPATFISGNVQILRRFWKDAEVMLRAGLGGGGGDAQIQRKLEFILEEMPKALDGIHGGVKRISNIVKGLKAYARSGNSPKAPCKVDRCVRHAVDLCRYQLKRAEATVECEVADDLPEVFADPQQLEQVLVNLLVNGADAMAGQDNPSLRVTGNSDGDSVFVSVEDSGPGIAADIIDKIWNPFFTTKATGKGTGLGLAICKGIVEDHGGQLSVENKREGGARFRLTLPVIARSQA